MHGATSIHRPASASAVVGLALLGLAACAGEPDLAQVASPTATPPAKTTASDQPSTAPSATTPSPDATAGSEPSDEGLRVADILRGLDLQDAPEGVAVTFDANLLFGTDSAELTSEGKEALAGLIEALGRLDDTPVWIHGHSDRGGAGEDARVFAHQRAAAIAVYVVEEGISADRLTVDGFGPSDGQRVEVILPTVDEDVATS